MNAPKAPSPWPPRVWRILESRCTGFARAYETQELAWADIQHNDNEHIVMRVSEHTHLLAEAVREAKAQAFEEAYRLITSGEASSSGLLVRAYRLREKASELRKGATPENGGKDGAD